jgi:site-specific DNA-cytosine methylase
MNIEVIDLFAGGGGATEGFIQGGGNVVLAVDSWDSAIKLHELNHPEIPIINEILGTKTNDEYIQLFLEFIENPDHVHLHGSPPCQAISNASRTNKSNGYFMVDWFISLAKDMKKVSEKYDWSFSWTMENVKPIASYLKEKRIPYVCINSANEGVPQTRERIFAGEGWFYEQKYHKSEWISVIQALPHLDNEISTIPSMSDNWSNLSVYNVFPTITQISPKQIKVKDNQKQTKKIRSLNFEEVAILQGYPAFKTNHEQVCNSDKWKILGNMVCPPVASAIIKAIKKEKTRKTLFSRW